MPYISNTDAERQEMLKSIGVEHFTDLLNNIPEKFRPAKLDLDKPLSELELRAKFDKLGNANIPTSSVNSFLGAGVYDHFIPAAVDHIILKPEFHTAYTPYQAEVSQGTLQAIYEYQTMICELTGMEIANAGMYDGASATAEAILMAVRKTRLNRAVLAGNMHPAFIEVVKAYTEGIGLELEIVEAKNGTICAEDVKKAMNDQTACFVLQTPNFYGCIEDAFAIEEVVHSFKKALFVVAVDPISLAVLNAPSEYKADIVVGEGQALGNGMNFGGPLFGFFATNLKLARSMPGRISGGTLDVDGKRAYSLTLQAREQHIRREKATSNICSNQALCSLAACVYMSLIGRQGLKEVATQSTTKAHYLANEIAKIDGFKVKFDKPFFKEFAIETKMPVNELLKKLQAKGIYGGFDLANNKDNGLLIAVTEKKTKADLDAFVKALQEVK